MANIPTNISYGTVVGQYIAAVGDTTDTGREPDAIPLQGYITFTPQVSYVKNITANPNPVTIAKTPVIGVLDSEGYLCNQTIDPDTGFFQRGVPLVATDDPEMNPSNWTWKVAYTFSLDGRPITSPTSHSISIPSGEVVDLTTVSPVASSTGDAVVMGPQGAPGDMVASLFPQSWTGAVSLTTFPATYLATLTGNVTAIALPTPPEGLSATITLVLTQDATGSRTITWPSSVKWSEGLVQQPSPGANTMTIFNLLWTGVTWVGMIGGRSFA